MHTERLAHVKWQLSNAGTKASTESSFIRQAFSCVSSSSAHTRTLRFPPPPPLLVDPRESAWGNQKPRLCHFRFHYRFFTVPCVCVFFFVSSIHISVHHGSQHTSTHVKRLQGSGCRCNPECGERCRQSNTVETRKCKAFSGGLMVRSFSPRTTTTEPGGTMRIGDCQDTHTKTK